MALAHLISIQEFISQNSPVYALRVIDRITRRSEQIAMFPRSGREVPGYGRADLREIIEGNYRIIYRIKPDQVDVLAVVHTARQLPPIS